MFVADVLVDKSEGFFYVNCFEVLSVADEFFVEREEDLFLEGWMKGAEGLCRER